MLKFKDLPEPMGEFELIQRYFRRTIKNRQDVVVGIGDDCAVVTVPQDKRLVMSLDTLVAGVHFFSDMPPEDLGYRALAVCLSDLAAMGAEPAWVTLGLTLPKADPQWLEAFSKGFFSLADRYNLQLIGGDTTQGALSITCQVHGFVPMGNVILRRGAKPGDHIFVTGDLGGAALALDWLSQDKAPLLEQYPEVKQRFYRPQPQIEAGCILCDYASSAIDISDGLAADLTHLLETDQLGARVYIEQIPINKALKKFFSNKRAQNFALTTGDDYQLCFTMENDSHQLKALMDKLPVQITCIGSITESGGLTILDSQSNNWQLPTQGYQHFSAQ